MCQADFIEASLEEARQDHWGAKQKVRSPRHHHDRPPYTVPKALVRDGFRCMITGRYDSKSIDRIVEQPTLDAVTFGLTYSRCVHIFSESTNAGLSDGNKVCVVSGVCPIAEMALMSGLTMLPVPEP